jgi:hypothetical protein
VKKSELQQIIREELKKTLNESTKYVVTWSDRDYKEYSKEFTDDPQGAPENGLLKAKKYLEKLNQKDKQSSYGLYRSLNLKTVNESINESYDLEAVKYSSAVKTQVNKLVKAIEDTPSLNKNAVASILNDIILALGLDRVQVTLYMNMIKKDREKDKF